MEPNFNLKFTEFHTCGFHVQCMRPREKMPNADVPYFQCNPNATLWFVWIPLIAEN